MGVLMVLGSNVSDNESTLWLARSCVGEAGWKSHQTGECVAILYVYQKRATNSGKSVLQIAKEFSAAIKRRKRHPHKWIFGLDMSGGKPARWPRRMLWPRFVFDWLQTVFTVTLFERGLLRDPLPESWNYGAVTDIPPSNCIEIETPGFGNKFYRRK